MKNILQKLHKVMTDVGYVQKDARNTHHGYSYASERVIKLAVHKALVDNGVVFQLQIISSKVIDKPSSTVLECLYTFFDIETGENLSGEFISSGPARDDKGHWASVTNAIKYVMTSQFLIPTGDDAESEVNHPPAVAVQPAENKNTPNAKSKFWRELQLKAVRDRVDLPKDKADIVSIINRLGHTEVAKSVAFEHNLTHPLQTPRDDNSANWEHLGKILSGFDLKECCPPTNGGEK